MDASALNPLIPIVLSEKYGLRHCLLELDDMCKNARYMKSDRYQNQKVGSLAGTII